MMTTDSNSHQMDSDVADLLLSVGCASNTANTAIVPSAIADMVSDLRKNIRREIDGKVWTGSYCLMKLHVLVVNYGVRITDVSRYLGMKSVRSGYKKWKPRILNQIAIDNNDTAENPPSKHFRIIT
jgi:hypothetical protein